MAEQRFVESIWTGGAAFESHYDNHTVRIDTMPPLGENTGVGPKNLVLVSLAGCSGLDVISLLKKMRVEIDSFRMQVEADLAAEHPKSFTQVRMTYIFSGSKLKREKIEKAVDLSQTKLCGVAHMVRSHCPLDYEVEFED